MQEALIGLLGRLYGDDIDFIFITKPRIIEASITLTNAPCSSTIKHVFKDAINPNRQEAIRAAFFDLELRGVDAFDHDMHTAMAGERITGRVLGQDSRVASLATDRGS
ncbi:hypothetical protein M8994_16075 [Brucella sp. 21LCYQ03]|nr:hypothetical protein [Brucella sp. 21LCYQ03]